MTNPERLLAWRRLAGLSQEKAADRFGVGQGTWAPWELGKKSPGRENALALEKFTDGNVPAAGWAPRKKAKRARRPIEHTPPQAKAS